MKEDIVLRYSDGSELDAEINAENETLPYVIKFGDDIFRFLSAPNIYVQYEDIQEAKLRRRQTREIVKVKLQYLLGAPNIEEIKIADGNYPELIEFDSRIFVKLVKEYPFDKLDKPMPYVETPSMKI